MHGERKVMARAKRNGQGARDVSGQAHGQRVDAPTPKSMNRRCVSSVVPDLDAARKLTGPLRITVTILVG